MSQNKNFCFCGLALGKRYRNCAVNLAKDLQNYHPGVTYLTLTDNPHDFDGLSNVIAIKHKQDSIMFPYHDRRLAIQEALLRFDIAIQIDTDIRVLKPLTFPPNLISSKGLVGRTENLSEHLKKYQPENLLIYSKIADKLQMNFADVPYIGEFIFTVIKDEGKERDFIKYWGIIGRYLELHRVHGADGPAIGLAAAKAGLEVRYSNWPILIQKEFVEHLKFSSGKEKLKKSFSEKLKFRLKYHYRLNKARLVALKDFNFYYE